MKPWERQSIHVRSVTLFQALATADNRKSSAEHLQEGYETTIESFEGIDQECEEATTKLMSNEMNMGLTHGHFSRGFPLFSSMKCRSSLGAFPSSIQVSVSTIANSFHARSPITSIRYQYMIFLPIPPLSDIEGQIAFLRLCQDLFENAIVFLTTIFYAVVYATHRCSYTLMKNPPISTNHTSRPPPFHSLSFKRSYETRPYMPSYLTKPLTSNIHLMTRRREPDLRLFLHCAPRKSNRTLESIFQIP